MFSVELPAENPSLSTLPPSPTRQHLHSLEERFLANWSLPPIKSRAICHNGPYIFGRRSAELVLLEFIGFYFLAPFPPLQDDFIQTAVPSTRVVPVRDRLCASLMKQGSVMETLPALASFN